MEPNIPFEKVELTYETCAEVTGIEPLVFAELTGIYAYSEAVVYDISGTNLVPIVDAWSMDENVRLRRYFNLEFKEIENGIIEVTDKGKGTGLKIFSQQVMEAMKHGFSVISCVATMKRNEYNGHYTWARTGYIIDEDYRSSVEDHFQEHRKACDTSFPHQIVRRNDLREWWKENGISWNGEFSLAKGSESLRTLAEYRKEKMLRSRP